MRYRVMSFNLEQKYALDLQTKVTNYNYQYQNYTDSELLLTDLKQNCLPTIVAIDIDNNQQLGYKLCSEAKQINAVVPIFISSQSNPDAQLKWIKLGAKSYIIKPFHIEELLERTTSHIHQSEKFELRDSNFVICHTTHEILFNGEPIKATPKVYDLITYFVKHEGQVITRQQIMSEVLKADHFLTDRNIDTLIKEIRKLTSSRMITTIRGVGYKYEEYNL